MKRPSCKWKGQTDADEVSTGSAGSPISRMPQRTEGGLRPTRQPKYHAFSRMPQGFETMTRQQTIQIEQHIIPNLDSIEDILSEMRDNGKSTYTINNTKKALRFLAQYTSLKEPNAVKHFIAEHKVSQGYKRNLCIAYNAYCKHYNIQWQMPTYHPEPRNITLPTKERIMMLVAEAGKLHEAGD